MIISFSSVYYVCALMTFFWYEVCIDDLQIAYASFFAVELCTTSYFICIGGNRLAQYICMHSLITAVPEMKASIYWSHEPFKIEFNQASRSSLNHLLLTFTHRVTSMH